MIKDKEFTIHSNIKNYTVYIKSHLDFLENTYSSNTKYVIDKKVYNLYSKFFKYIPNEQLLLIEAIEKNKVIETVLQICEQMTEMPSKRNTRLVSIGGGIIQDITGFVANVLYRGIDWVFIPTTLLAACDSCIGGKTSLNFKDFKNLLGTFYPPDSIYICPKFFETLSNSDFESGMGEVIKFNIMAGSDEIDNLLNEIDNLMDRDNKSLSKYIEKSLIFKKKFIEIDEYDRGERIKLNFAHTFGHAIETATNFQIPHGTSVAIGMIMANYISYKRGLLDIDILHKSEVLLLEVIHIDIELLNVPANEFIHAIKKDKKQVNNCLTAVLMSNSSERLEIIHDMTEQEVCNAIGYFLNLYSKRN